LDEELFISLATLSEYVRVAEHADSMARKAGKMVDIDSEPTVDMEFDVDTSSSQESTLPDEINEDDERRYQGEEERDEERAERGDPSVMNAKTLCPTAEVQRTTVGQPALMGRGSAAALPLLVEHSHISGLGGQRLVSVIQ
jgi:hypothetical protein